MGRLPFRKVVSIAILYGVGRVDVYREFSAGYGGPTGLRLGLAFGFRHLWSCYCAVACVDAGDDRCDD